jgi:mRNA interferase RelE/StbE
MPANEARRIRAKVQQYADNPASLANNVKKLRESRYHPLGSVIAGDLLRGRNRR